MKKFVLIILVICVVLFLSACDPTMRYKEENPELHVIATNSLLGVSGYENDSVFVLEHDDYGRTMFSYTGASTNGSVLAILISQKTNEKDSFFYDNVNFIFCEANEYKATKDIIINYFTEKELEKLKQTNDWNKEINENKLFKVPITRIKSIYLEMQEELAAFQKVSEDYHRGYSVPVTLGSDGKILYYMIGMKHEEQGYSKSGAYLFMFDKDGEVLEETGITEVIDVWNYQEQLKEFKEANNWKACYK